MKIPTITDHLSQLREVFTLASEQEEASREAVNDSLRENAAKAMQDSHRLYEWILQDFQQPSSLKNREIVAL